MPVTGLFFLPGTSSTAAPTQDILSRLTANYNVSPLPPWSASHRLFRESPSDTPAFQPSPTSNGTTNPKSLGPRYLQILSLSHHAPRTHVAITATHAPSQTRAGTPASSNLSGDFGSSDPATIISIPSGPQTEEFIQLILSKFGPLWQQRGVSNVGNGQAFEIDDYRIRVGEVRQSHGGVGQTGRGSICEIEWMGDADDEDDKDMETAEAAIKGFWEGLGIRGARECFFGARLDKEEGIIRQWCEVLRNK